MGRNKASIGERELALALAERESLREWKTVFKLSAIVAYAKHTAETVAPIFGVTTESVIRWAASFKKSGVEGLRDKAKGHKLRRIKGDDAKQIRQWILSGRDAEGKIVHWTLKRLCHESAKVLGVEIGHTAMAECLHDLGLAVKRPRPAHYKSDPVAAAEFKKKPQREPRAS